MLAYLAHHLRVVSMKLSQQEIYPEFDPADESEICIVGNIIDKHYFGVDKEVRRGTKHFKPNTKVYCFPEYAGMGHESMAVLGRARESGRFIKIVIQTKYIQNFRVKDVYSPLILEYIRKSIYYSNVKRDKTTRENMEKRAKSFNTVVEEIQKK